jgi:integral membrane protein
MALLKNFRYVALAEGVSYLLFAVTMPLKYGYEIGLPNKIVGLAHGVLFVVYVLLALYCAYRLKWKFLFLAGVLLASLIPFGTFYLDAKYLKPANT